MRRKMLLYAGGILTFCFALLHASFWKLGNWNAELLRISADNKGIVEMLNIASIYMLLFAVFVSFYLAKKTVFTFTEKALILFIAGYYLLRIAFGVPLFGVCGQEIVIWIACLAVASCYLFALRPE
ncbi:hypothetical protein JW960_21320 [candidate division KSB1 bacterium]|nr:hypothetical protein [candidate division KSB1 bacterium]